MAVYVVTGKLGSGKTLIAVSKIREYLARGCVVATNLDLNTEHLVNNPFAKNTKIFRVSDKPTVEELNLLPEPYQGDYDEKKSGLLVFDECATWFNSRTWNDKTRKGLIDWLLHARKLGWDIIFIIQNVNMMDSQAREGFAEMVVHCRRADRLAIPFVSAIGRAFGLTIRPPKVHWGIVKYGASESSLFIERWVYTGTDLYKAYDTRQVFTENSDGFSSILPPYTVYGRNTTHAEHNKRGLINAINKFTEGSQPRAAFFIGLLVASLGFSLWPNDVDVDVVATAQADPKKEIAVDSSKEIKTVFDGVVITASVKGTKSFDYVFQRGDDVVYPKHMGFNIRYVNECKASVYNDTENFYLTCSPYRASRSHQPREGAEGERGLSDVEIVSNSL